MNNAIFNLTEPKNEPVLNYLKGSPERQKLENEILRQNNDRMEIPLIIGGKEVYTGQTVNITKPHDHGHVLGIYHKAGVKEVNMAIEAALQAKELWMGMDWVERSSIFMKVAELISKKYRDLINASTILGQGKNAFQAEIDAACEVIDYLRFNTYFASQIYNQQPRSDTETLNRLEYRPLEGFVFAVSPFNFTAIALNLSLSPALMGNTIVWKPASTSILSNYYLMKIYKEAGLPDGVINFIPGQGSVVGDMVLKNKHLAGVHFTGGTNTFNHIWKKVAENLETYISYPKIVGETGGKGFIFAHPSACPTEVATAMVKGAFEYQGQKCSAASRAYIPLSLWDEVKKTMLGQISEIRIGSAENFEYFMNAVIDEASFKNIMHYIQIARESESAGIITGGNGDMSKGYFIEPTVVLVNDPQFITMQEEIFGPVLSVYVYKDEDFSKTLELCERTSPYALTGAIFAKERETLIGMCRVLRYAAGNFYYNDKPTGAMVGMQPFGGSRKSGTNDKAGGFMNLARWVSPRTVKETFLPSIDFRYSYMKE